jgi:predicted alpha-1,2-mannosidase
MVQLSPDTRLTGWDGCSGYHYTDSVVYGFSHTHLSGTGVSDYGDVLLMPTVGGIDLFNGYPDRADEGYASRFSKTSERAAPGFYATVLDDYGLEVELTCSKRAGFHRYTFPGTDSANVIIDLEHRDRALDSKIAIVGDNEIEGFRISDAWAREQHVYFVVRFSRPFAGWGVSVSDSIVEAGAQASGQRVKAYVRFETEPGEEILVKVGISAVDIDGARRNLDTEIPHWDFDAVREEARREWNEELGRIEIEGGTAEEQTVFYTALYHTMIAPNLFSDVDGRYRGTDLEVHGPAEGDYYTVFSLWDTFRATHPLFTIIQRDRTVDFIRTMLAQFEHGGRLPVWELAGNYTGCMIGYHSVPVIVDAYFKGVRGFDAELALGAMTRSAEDDGRGLDSYKDKGYIPATDEGESVSKTLEYAYDDWCIARFAKALGEEDVYRRYMERAQFYKNLFCPDTGFMRPRVNGGWVEPFDPAEVNFHYTEANCWQYSLFVPHDIEGLMGLLGGPEGLERKLDGLFESTGGVTGRNQADITGLIGQYAHGNEPSHHMAYLYNYAGAPWKTQLRARQIMDELYSADPGGLAGNEDCGQMSAWYVLSAMGFYPVTPGAADYAIGTPVFDRVTVQLENGRRFVISAENASVENFYVQSAALDGIDYTKSYLSHRDILAGGEIAFQMGPEPNRRWGAGPGDIPVSSVRDHLITPVPYVIAASRTFVDSLTVELGTSCGDCEILFTRDGSEPLENGEEYSRPLKIEETTVIKAVAVGSVPSRVVTAEFLKRDGSLKIEIGTRYASQYAAGGDVALIDMLRGSSNFRTGSWQGYQGVDLDATVDLGEVRDVSRIGAGFLQDIGSWIWFPTEVEYAVSTDGVSFTAAATLSTGFPDDRYGAFVEEYSAEVKTRARYVRVRAKNYGQCPEWHLGAGGRAWIFVDEITIE